MANTEDKVMAWVEAELAKNPEAKSGDLFEKAKSTFDSVGKLTVRQFHARYPLQVKRRAKSGGAKRASKKAAAGKRAPRKARAKTAASKKPASKKSATKKSPRKRAARGRAAIPEPRNAREAVRGVLMRFATELASAEAKAEVVKVLAGADRYVDEVLDVAGS